ncbi:hypothetical protein Y032_0030g2078 [Ancylostoma ceylanicum]|uniref:Uncharacterized protein n=1 Tax=Ancylostoma ceylanicum TaxID=53326 RepID=A0A016URD8_9BILA|nr:hypothetical protein Y032_0030g2078 [Ancylostoma ceylanicum]
MFQTLTVQVCFRRKVPPGTGSSHFLNCDVFITTSMSITIVMTEYSYSNKYSRNSSIRIFEEVLIFEHTRIRIIDKRHYSNIFEYSKLIFDIRRQLKTENRQTTLPAMKAVIATMLGQTLEKWKGST